MNKEEADDIVPNAPLVFQCKQCHDIIADSLSWKGMIEDLKLLCLSDVPRKRVRLSKSKYHNDESVFQHVNCAKCHASLGKYYFDPPNPYMELKQSYGIELDKIESYQLGCYMKKEALEALYPQSASNHSNIEERLSELESFVVQLCNRVSELENEDKEVYSIDQDDYIEDDKEMQDNEEKFEEEQIKDKIAEEKVDEEIEEEKVDEEIEEEKAEIVSKESDIAIQKGIK